MPKWLKIILIILVSILVVLVLCSILIKSRQVSVLNLSPNYSLKIDNTIWEPLSNEIKDKQLNNKGIVILVSPFYKTTINGASVRGTTFIHTETNNSLLGISIIKVYINRSTLDSLDQKKMDESLCYFLVRQILISRGISTYNENNEISYKYGIKNSDLFELVKKN